MKDLLTLLTEKKNLQDACEELSSIFSSFEKIKEDFTILHSRVNKISNNYMRRDELFENINTEENRAWDALMKLWKNSTDFMNEYFSEYVKISSISFQNQLVLKLAGKYEVGTLIINGNSAVFFKGIEKHSERQVIIRALKKHEFAKNQKEKGKGRINEERLKRIYNFKHRNIVKVLGTYLIDFPYCLILEYIDGISLKELLKAFPFTTGNAIEIAEQLADAVYYLHTHNEFHKRIRPSKILIDNELNAVISPFEILGSRDVELDSQNIIEELLYTPPEILSGYLNEPDDKSDQFSLALVIYEMITGVPLFKGETDSVREVFLMRKRFFAPDNQEIKQNLLNGIPDFNLRRIIEKMLEEKPDKRFLSMGEVVEQLKNLQRVKDENIELALASYRRCCVRNPDFAESFYKNLFNHKRLGSKIKSKFDSEEEHDKIKSRKRKLRSALLLLLGDSDSIKAFQRIPNIKGHKGLTIRYYKAFIDVLIKTVSETDYLWDRYKEENENKLFNAWETVKERALHNLGKKTRKRPVQQRTKNFLSIQKHE